MSLSYMSRYRDSIIKLYLFSYNARHISIEDVYKPSNIFLDLCTRTKIKSITREFLQYLPFCRIVFRSRKLSSCPSKLPSIDFYSSKSNDRISIEEIDERSIRHDASTTSPAAHRPQHFNIFALLNARSRRKFARLVARQRYAVTAK